eukprot:5426974-Lingulodinium_polyedra.AAC.1
MGVDEPDRVGPSLQGDRHEPAGDRGSGDGGRVRACGLLYPVHQVLLHEGEEATSSRVVLHPRPEGDVRVPELVGNEPVAVTIAVDLLEEHRIVQEGQLNRQPPFGVGDHDVPAAEAAGVPGGHLDRPAERGGIADLDGVHVELGHVSPFTEDGELDAAGAPLHHRSHVVSCGRLPRCTHAFQHSPSWK